jgi:RNA polymerase sigma factor (sigma-70 family)
MSSPASVPDHGGGKARLPGLVAAAVDGDSTAWAELVDRFAPLVWSIAYSFRMSTTDRDDVTQAIWLRLLEHLPSIRVPEALPGWLVTTSRRECLRHLGSAQRRASQEAAIFEDQIEARELDHDELLLRAERRDALRADFAVLGERCRRLLTLLFADPRPAYEEVSATLNMPIGSIGPTRARCLQRLRSLPATSALLERSEHD